MPASAVLFWDCDPTTNFSVPLGRNRHAEWSALTVAPSSGPSGDLRCFLHGNLIMEFHIRNGRCSVAASHCGWDGLRGVTCRYIRELLNVFAPHSGASRLDLFTSAADRKRVGVADWFIGERGGRRVTPVGFGMGEHGRISVGPTMRRWLRGQRIKNYVE